MSLQGQTATCQPNLAMSALPPVPEAIGEHQFSSSGKFRRVFKNPIPVDPPRTFGRHGDDGADLL
jgi:hypothetical protein